MLEDQKAVKKKKRKKSGYILRETKRRQVKDDKNSHFRDIDYYLNDRI
jgi:hypothetical protein